jgi:nifR3 family TIM-barrel protein
MTPMIASPQSASRSGEGPARNDGAGPQGASSPNGRPDGSQFNTTPGGQPAASAVDSPIDSRHEPNGGNRTTCHTASADPDAGQAPSGAPPTAAGQAAPPAAPSASPPFWPGPLHLSGNGIDRQLHCRVLQSPLAGVSDRIFRSLVRRWAPDALLFTEMVNATGLELGHGRSKLDDLAGESGPIAVQLFDHRPAAMAEAARRAEACGAFLIDINMGCPVPKISRKGGGSGLIREPELAARIVAAVAGAVNIPVTVKTRLGWCGSSADPVSFALVLQNAGARALTLHGRTREQGFKGQADWAAIAAVKRALTIPLIANGDVGSPEEALRCLAATGADAVMVGRGTMGAPWLVGRIDAALRSLPVPPIPDAGQRLALAAEQLEALLEARGERGLLIARKHLGWTCQGFAGAAELRHALMRAGTPHETRELLARASERIRENGP